MKVVAVEPAPSAVLSTGVADAHKIQGIGAGFLLDVLNTVVYDAIILVVGYSLDLLSFTVRRNMRF